MRKERDFDNFDEFAKDYRSAHDSSIKISGADSSYFSQYKIFELLKFEDSAKELRILDFGCGDGNSSIYLREYFPKASIVGVDVSEMSIEIARKKQIANTTFRSYNGKQLPFSIGEFDFVFTSMVFHHIDHKLHHNVLIEIYRVLKVGGRFYNFEHNPNNPFTRKVVGDCKFDRDAMLLRPSYNKSITNGAGFLVDKLNYTLFFPRYNFLYFLHGLEKLLTWCPIGAQYYIRAVK